MSAREPDEDELIKKMSEEWSEGELMGLTNAELKSRCAAAGLPVTGPKSKLVAYLMDPEGHQKKKKRVEIPGANKKKKTYKAGKASIWVKGGYTFTSGGRQDNYSYRVATKMPQTQGRGYEGWALEREDEEAGGAIIPLTRDRQAWSAFLDFDGREAEDMSKAAFVVSKRPYDDSATARAWAGNKVTEEGRSGNEVDLREDTVVLVTPPGGDARRWVVRWQQRPRQEPDKAVWGVVFREGEETTPRVPLSKESSQGLALNEGGFDALKRVEKAAATAPGDAATEEESPVELEIYEELKAFTAADAHATACLIKITSGVDGSPGYVATLISPKQKRPPSAWASLIRC